MEYSFKCQITRSSAELFTAKTRCNDGGNVKCHRFLEFTPSSKHLDNWATLNCSVNVANTCKSVLDLFFRVNHDVMHAHTHHFSDQYTHSHTNRVTISSLQKDIRVKRRVAVNDVSKLSLHTKHIIQTRVMTYRCPDIKDRHS